MPETVYELPYHPPLAWDELLHHFAGRALHGVEVRNGDLYRRVLRVGHAVGVVSVSPIVGKDALAVTLSPTLSPFADTVLAQAAQTFDTAADTTAIVETLGDLAADCPGLRVPGAFDPFELLVRAILGQQVTVAAAATIAGRFAVAFGTPVETGYDGLTHVFPTPERVLEENEDSIAAKGIIGSRARSILALANAVTTGAVSLTPARSEIAATCTALKTLPGIGQWTAQVAAMRAFGDPDAFPHTDLGIYQALGTKNPKETLARAEAWRPFRSYATLHLWRSLRATL